MVLNFKVQTWKEKKLCQNSNIPRYFAAYLIRKLLLSLWPKSFYPRFPYSKVFYGIIKINTDRSTQYDSKVTKYACKYILHNFLPKHTLHVIAWLKVLIWSYSRDKKGPYPYYVSRVSLSEDYVQDMTLSFKMRYYSSS